MLHVLRHNPGRFLGILVLGVVPALGGCSLHSLVEFFPADTVGSYERELMIITFALMLFVFIPVVTLTLFFAWRYRASNTKARYEPRWSHSIVLELFLWGGPIVIIGILSVVTWYSTYALDPYAPPVNVKKVAAKADPVQIDVIGMDWKWLFVYPQYNVASVNEMAMPVNTPISIHLTSDTVMMGFMIPQMGSQILAMSGMQTQLHILPTRTGTFFGKNYQYNGEGFAKEKFHAITTSKQNFKAWIQKAKASSTPLDTKHYAQLTKPSETNAVSFYSPVKPHLFRYVIGLYHNGKPRNQLTKTAER